jgi:DNA polymerase III subunit delta'
MIYPWQKEQWMRLWQAKEANRLAHALLLAGAADLGKLNFAMQFILALFCEQPLSDHLACKRCHACRLINNQSHPNVLILAPEKPGQAIKINQIREACDFVHHTSLKGIYCVVLIPKAEAMNANAANALLKTLEEPPAHALIILSSDQPSQLLLTIRSRCHNIVFPKPKAQQALPWLQEQINNPSIDAALLLKLSFGAPLMALKLAEDENHLLLRKIILDSLINLSFENKNPLQLASALQEAPIEMIIHHISAFVSDILRLQLTHSASLLINADYAEALTRLSSKKPSSAVLAFLDEIKRLSQEISQGFNLNKQLMLESLCIRWCEGNNLALRNTL